VVEVEVVDGDNGGGEIVGCGRNVRRGLGPVCFGVVSDIVC
jgi:hypothetical protein